MVDDVENCVLGGAAVLMFDDVEDCALARRLRLEQNAYQEWEVRE